MRDGGVATAAHSECGTPSERQIAPISGRLQTCARDSDDMNAREGGEDKERVSNTRRREYSYEGTDVRCGQPRWGPVHLKGSDSGRDGDCRSTEGCTHNRLLLDGGVLEGGFLVHGRVGTHCVMLVGTGVGEVGDARAGAVRESAIDADGDEEGRAGSYSAVSAAGCCVRMPERSEMKVKARLVRERLVARTASVWPVRQQGR